MFKVELTRQSEKALAILFKSQPEMARRIANSIDTIAKDPSAGIPLKGELKGLFKYRVGVYRIIYRIKHSQLIITVIDIGHRKDVYR